MERMSLFIFKPIQQSYSRVSALAGNFLHSLVLPVYTSKTESFYKTKNIANEWVTGKEQKVNFTSN